VEGTAWKSQKVNPLSSKTDEMEFADACLRWEGQDAHRVSPSLLIGFFELITQHENTPPRVNVFWMSASLTQRYTSFARPGEAPAAN